MSKGKLLAQGRTAEVFTWGDAHVLKLLRDHAPTEAAREAKITQLAQANGVNTPAVEGVVEIEGRSGIIFERIAGPTLLSQLSRQPWHLISYARQFAELHLAIHQSPAPNLSPFHTIMAQRIATVEALTPSMKQNILNTLTQIPTGDRLLHGDFHPDNIIAAPQGLVIIDWLTAIQGPPIAEVAFTALLFKAAALPSTMPVSIRLMTNLFRNLFRRTYLGHYCHLSGLKLSQISALEGLAAAARLSDNIPAEKATLLKIVQTQFA